ncbi:MAG: EAL domain-containing protein [Leptospirales bacterium]|nr:EAL domain-containing protein [Leptospirales bacterium]
MRAPAEFLLEQPGALQPFFQPIISVADGRIFGYEALARLRVGDEQRSLGAFFSSADRTREEKLNLDRRLRSLSLQRAREANISERLFLNIHPSWISARYAEELDFPTLQIIDETGFPAEQVVIEIIEEEIRHEDFDLLNRLLDRYRERGMKIAIDDFSYPNFDRLISLRPDFVKVDIRLIRKSVESAEYRRLIRYIGEFSQELGVAVLFEGVETLVELENSIEAGGSLVQGFFFSEAREDFQAPDVHQGRIRLGLNNITYRAMLKSESTLRIEDSMNRYLALVIAREQVFVRSNLDEALSRIAAFLPPQCFRAFICDGLGIQRSSNFTRTSGDQFKFYPEYRGKNWAWRPYFFPNVVRMRAVQRGVVSNRYVDFETRRHTLTFSYPLGSDLYIFLDFDAEH